MNFEAHSIEKDPDSECSLSSSNTTTNSSENFCFTPAESVDIDDLELENVYCSCQECGLRLDAFYWTFGPDNIDSVM